MKAIVLPFFLGCVFTLQGFSAENPDHKTANFIKIWGFLKYYHPEVAKGKIDWDDSFLTGLDKIRTLESKSQLNAFYLTWIDKLGPGDKCSNCKIQAPANAKFNLDMGWLRDSTHFDDQLIEKLSYIQKNRNQKENYYISSTQGAGNPDFKNEKIYKDSIFPSTGMRLLTLSRYWNMINYFFPYRYQTDQPWNEVLAEMIPKFQNARDTTAYHLAILELTAKIDDSHAKFSTPYTDKHFGDNWMSFKFKIIDQKAVVTGFYNDSLSSAADIRIGDAFLSFSGKSIEQLLAENARYIGASNPSVKLRDLHHFISHSNTVSMETQFERDGAISKKTIPMHSFKQLNYTWGQDLPKDTIRILKGNIGYVNMGNLTKDQMPGLISRLKGTRAIIFDVRNYPKGTLYAIANFLNEKRTPFVMATTPDPKHPGTFKNSGSVSAGTKNRDNYKGKVILLCNENSQSHAEFTLMALQTAPNVTTIGSQTSGADGNVSLITLPGGFKTYMTGLGIYYPDGRETQRIGIVPDIIVRPTIEGIREGRDEVMEKALEVIGKK